MGRERRRMNPWRETANPAREFRHTVPRPFFSEPSPPARPLDRLPRRRRRPQAAMARPVDLLSRRPLLEQASEGWVKRSELDDKIRRHEQSAGGEDDVAGHSHPLPDERGPVERI